MQISTKQTRKQSLNLHQTLSIMSFPNALTGGISRWMNKWQGIGRQVTESDSQGKLRKKINTQSISRILAYALHKHVPSASCLWSINICIHILIHTDYVSNVSPCEICCNATQTIVETLANLSIAFILSLSHSRIHSVTQNSVDVHISQLCKNSCGCKSDLSIKLQSKFY